MRYRYLLSLIVFIVLFSCKKEKGTDTTNVTTAPPVTPSSLLLKEIVIPNLPSPYYHFEYNSSGKAVFVSFASELTRYNIIYQGDRIIEMRNNILVNKDRLQYFYDNSGRVNSISYADSTGIVYTVVNFSYQEQKLIKVERNKKTGQGFVTDKTIVLSYYPDGNVMELVYHYLPVNGQNESSFTERFEQYDKKPNVDGFDLVHNDFFDHFIYLPNVLIQINNPGKEILTGGSQDYEVNYTYTYNDKGYPSIKKGDLLITKGTGTGQRIETNSFYSYYGN